MPQHHPRAYSKDEEHHGRGREGNETSRQHSRAPPSEPPGFSALGLADKHKAEELVDIYLTCLELLHDRGYQLMDPPDKRFVRSDDCTRICLKAHLYQESFVQTFLETEWAPAAKGQFVGRIKDVNWAALDLKAVSRTRPDDLVYICFPAQWKIDENLLKFLFAMSVRDNIQRLILIEAGSHEGARKLVTLMQAPVVVELWRPEELRVAVPQHEYLGCSIRILDDTEKSALSATDKQRMVRLLSMDPISRWYNLSVGTVVEFTSRISCSSEQEKEVRILKQVRD